jgi:hypothetical protein
MLEFLDPEVTYEWDSSLDNTVWQMSLETSLERSSSDLDTDLMNFYLDEIAPLFCCYAASDKNPFHHLIAKAWNSELRTTKYAAVIKASQSLAAIFMSARGSSLQLVARDLQREAQSHIDLFSMAEGYDSMTVLALHLLGASAMYSQDIAYWHLTAEKLQKILMLDEPGNREHAKTIKLHERERQFFWGLHMYNQLHTTFVELHLSLPPIEIPKKYFEDIAGIRRCPHPFTGVSSHITFSFLAVGKLIKRQRQYAKSLCFTTEQQIRDLQDLISEAIMLEAMILTQNVPEIKDIEDPNDEATPIEHLFKIAECHRNAALLQLYRVFPDVLRRRLEPNDTGISTDGFLLSLALRILDTLRSIPVHSGTTPFQTVLLLAISSELKFDGDVEDDDEVSHIIKIVSAREWTLERLSETQKSIPGQRLYNLMGKVRQVWTQLDAAEPREVVYWLDFMV